MLVIADAPDGVGIVEGKLGGAFLTAQLQFSGNVGTVQWGLGLPSQGVAYYQAALNIKSILWGICAYSYSLPILGK